MKRALLYSPYLDIAGGGERHVISMMHVLSKAGYAIDIAWDDEMILQKIKNVLHIDTSNMSQVPNFLRSDKPWDKYKKTQAYDIVLYVTDGSYFFSGAKQNFIFFMYPSKKLLSLSFLNFLKLHNWTFIANGDFTAEILGNSVHKPVHVVPPYIENDFFKLKGNKSKTILSVGRIFKHLHSKKQDIIIKAFMNFKDTYPECKDFKLVVAGGFKDEDSQYLSELQSLAKNRKDVTFKLNLSYQDLLKQYDSSMFYWHAAGYGADERENPEAVEHFGITPLEAMAAGCVTLCHASGGPARYIQDGETGYLYENIDELADTTAALFKEPSQVALVSKNARTFVSESYSYAQFEKRVLHIFNL